MVDLGCVQIPQYLGSCDVFPKLHRGPKNVEILHIFGPPYSHDCNGSRIAKMGQPKAKDIANNKSGTVFQNAVY